MIDYADKDRDGVINYDEFINIITKEYPKVWSLYKYPYHFFRLGQRRGRGGLSGQTGELIAPYSHPPETEGRSRGDYL